MREPTGLLRDPLLTAIVATGLLVGCTGSDTRDDAGAWQDQPYDQRVRTYLSEAESGGASAPQVNELREAMETGEVSYETLRAAVHRSVECMTEAGLTAHVEDTTTASGLDVPMYRASHGDAVNTETGWAAIRACDKQETYWLSAAYQQQPRARNLLGEYVQSKELELRECLHDNGVETDRSADGWELAHLALDAPSADEGAFGCLAAVGIDGL
ncbi:hypothetical protein [Demequina sediminicola]|uniref:hypothetical protein n=1 Tax=Demequina sediminicola TaxID=1095026 RepID=UPI0007832F99|nr:hypothetical protein [Demequina sediminicola]